MELFGWFCLDDRRRVRHLLRMVSDGNEEKRVGEGCPAYSQPGGSAEDFEKLGVFYLGRPYDHGSQAIEAGLAVVRLERFGHPCRLRRDDRKREDRPLHRICSKKRRSTASLR